MLRHVLSTVLLFCLGLLNSVAFAATSLNFDQIHNDSLDGEWIFYPKKRLDHLSDADRNAFKVQLPNSFLHLTGEKDGFGTFQQRFVLPDEALNQHVYIYAPYQYGAYQLYMNNHSIIRVGQVGDAASHQTEMAPKLASFLATEKDITISIEASSFRNLNGGLENKILIGFNRPILDKFYGQVISLSAVSGVLFMIGSFMVFFAVFRSLSTQVGNTLLFLGLFILCLSLRSFFAVPFIYTLFTEISWLWGTRFEYLLTQLACLFFLNYIYLLPYRLLNRYLFYITNVIILVNLAVTLCSEPVIFQSFFFQSFSIAALVFLNLIYAAIRMHRQGMVYSKLNSIAVIIVCLTFIHDYLLALKIIDSVEIAFYTSCIYFILMTFQLSRDYAVQSVNTEILNRKLMRWNKELDRTIKERTRDITLLNEELARQVRLDSLTGAYNRFALNEEIQQRYEDAIRENATLAFYMIDVDYFKKYNDYYGHLKGDYVLKEIVQHIGEILPKHAFLARYGGEEFGIVWPNCQVEDAIAFAEQICEQIRQQGIEHANRDDEKTWISVSVGMSIMDQSHPYRNVHRLMKVADQQLYLAKEGRDRAVIKY